MRNGEKLNCCYKSSSSHKGNRTIQKQ